LDARRMTASPPQRYGCVIRLRPGCYDEYKRYHAEVWPEILAIIAGCNIRDYSIYHHAGWLFASFEYHGSDYAADMAAMAAQPVMQRWWAIMEPMQDPLPTRAPGEWWTRMEEVFRME
jgi:L-rhamnose mutarotase